MNKKIVAIICFAALLGVAWFAPVIPTRQNKNIAPSGLPCGLKNNPNWNYIPCPKRSELFEWVWKSGQEIYQEYLIKNYSRKDAVF